MNTLFEKFKEYALTKEQASQVRGGEDTCKNSWSQSEVNFLMNANGWTKAKAERVLYLACVHAVTPDQ